MKKLLQTPFEIRRPFRLWMSGSIAVVMAAMMPIRDVSQSDRIQLMRLLRHSQFGVNETVRRLEATARDQGLPVLAMLPGERSILVLASSVGGTPVVMQEADSAPAMPLSLLVRGSRQGGADVLIASRAWFDLPAAVADELASLPQLVDRALV
ncbi:MAG: hypothetical protein ABI702_01130 [Burkholderiales bacterium]